MPPPAVYWYEGMFLRPHHFQAAEQHALHLAHTAGKWDHHFNWGLHAIEIDEEALANNLLVIRSLQARTRQGTLISVPADGDVDDTALQDPLKLDAKLNVFLCLPKHQDSRPNVPAEGVGGDVRYHLDRIEAEDENRSGNRQGVDVRRFNLKLKLDPEKSPAALAGYESLCVARVAKSDRVNAEPELDAEYIPPVLSCDAWPGLGEGVLQTIYHRIGKKIEMLVGLVKARRIGFESQAQGEVKLFQTLRMLNEGYALLGILAFVKGIHPLSAYLELCRLVGQLSILGDERRPPQLPPYDHDDLGGCFHAVRAHIDALLDFVESPRYEASRFIVQDEQLHATIQRAWVEQGWPSYIGVVSSLPPEVCVKMLQQGILDMKVGSPEVVAAMFTGGKKGLDFRRAASPPSALPTGGDLVYFQIERAPQTEQVWADVLRSGRLAMHLNRTIMAENTNGESVVKISYGGAVHRLEFTLYALPPDQGPTRAAAGAERRP